MGFQVAGMILHTIGMTHSNRARKQEKAARKVEQRAEAQRIRRERIEQLRQAQMARAEMAASIESEQLGATSAGIGALGSIGSQVGSNMLFQSQQGALRAEAQRRLDRAAYWNWRSNLATSIGGAVGSMGMAPSQGPQSDANPKTGAASEGTATQAPGMATAG